jgi:Ca2+-binding RTX toxin-like protein
MNRKNEVKPNIEHLDDRIVPSTIKGATSSHITYAYNDVQQKLVINTAPTNDSITLWGAGGDVWIIDGNAGPTYYYDTHAKLGPNLNIQINGSTGDDFIHNALHYFEYNSALIIAGSGNDLLWAGGGKDTLMGGTGNDCLMGSFGSLGGGATLVAGTGYDTFVVKNDLAFGSDTIKDFDPSNGVVYSPSPYTGWSIQASAGDNVGDPIILWLNGDEIWSSNN